MKSSINPHVHGSSLFHKVAPVWIKMCLDRFLSLLLYKYVYIIHQNTVYWLKRSFVVFFLFFLIFFVDIMLFGFSIFLSFCVCVMYMCVRACMLMTHVFMNVPYVPVRPKEDIVCLSLLLSALCLVFWCRVVHWNQISSFQPSCPVYPQICLSPLSASLAAQWAPRSACLHLHPAWLPSETPDLPVSTFTPRLRL